MSEFTKVSYAEFKLFCIDREAQPQVVGNMAKAKDDYFGLECLMTTEDKTDLESSFSVNTKIGNFYRREPFASKELQGGAKLFRRKHGEKATVLANSEKEVIFTVPYAQAKINKLEIVDANALDRVDMLVRSPFDANVAAAYGMPPDFMLNQFGFNVCVSTLLYSDKSDYDADVYAGFQIVIVYKNDTDADKEIGLNLVYHEVVS